VFLDSAAAKVAQKVPAAFEIRSVENAAHPQINLASVPHKHVDGATVQSNETVRFEAAVGKGR
jgi:hypothetical protein